MGSTRANIVFVASVAVGLAVFAAIALTGDGGLTWPRLGVATAAFLTVAPGGVWLAGRVLLK